MMQERKLSYTQSGQNRKDTKYNQVYSKHPGYYLWLDYHNNSAQNCQNAADNTADLWQSHDDLLMLHI